MADPAATAIFAALGDRTRLTLLLQLSDGARRSIATLSVDTGLTRQAVTKHLRVLERAGLVTSACAGRETRFAYRAAAVDEARACLDAAAAQWDGALGRLQAFVER